MSPKRTRAQPTPPPKNTALLPRLVRDKKPREHTCELPKPLRVGFRLEKFDNPDLPLIVLRPPTPMWEMYNVEERLFGRLGDVFMLRKSKACANFKQEEKKLLPMLVPVLKIEDLLVCGSEILGAEC